MFRRSTASGERVPAASLAVLAVLLLSLHFEPVNKSMLGVVAAAGAVLLAPLNPFLWMFFVAASHIVPEPAA
ncbi:MAG: hypothetical protein AAB225_08970, partial [Acidobacteriota bacterium]